MGPCISHAATLGFIGGWFYSELRCRAMQHDYLRLGVTRRFKARSNRAAMAAAFLVALRLVCSYSRERRFAGSLHEPAKRRSLCVSDTCPLDATSRTPLILRQA